MAPNNAHEAARAEALLAKETTHLPEGIVVIGETLDNNATTVAQVEQAGTWLCFSGRIAESIRHGSDSDAGADHIVCPAGKRSTSKI